MTVADVRLTLFETDSLWTVRDKSDPAALALADRHYSRRRPGSGQIGAAGRKLIFVSPDELAVWLTHWPEAGRAYDGLDAWRCSIFRNESDQLSSTLIVAAMELTLQMWEDRPADGWVTWVDTGQVASPNPGYCFKQAGWRIDRDWNPARGRRGRIRLRADV